MDVGMEITIDPIRQNLCLNVLCACVDSERWIDKKSERGRIREKKRDRERKREMERSKEMKKIKGEGEGEREGE